MPYNSSAFQQRNFWQLSRNSLKENFRSWSSLTIWDTVEEMPPFPVQYCSWYKWQNLVTYTSDSGCLFGWHLFWTPSYTCMLGWEYMDGKKGSKLLRDTSCSILSLLRRKAVGMLDSNLPDPSLPCHLLLGKSWVYILDGRLLVCLADINVTCLVTYTMYAMEIQGFFFFFFYLFPLAFFSLTTSYIFYFLYVTFSFIL